MGLKWEWYAARRGTSLRDFLVNVQTLEAAKEKFFLKSLIPPEDEKIIEILESYNQENKDLKETTVAPAEQKTLSSRVHAENEKTSTKSPTKKRNREAKDGKYFRKVLPTKKVKK